MENEKWPLTHLKHTTNNDVVVSLSKTRNSGKRKNCHINIEERIKKGISAVSEAKVKRPEA